MHRETSHLYSVISLLNTYDPKFCCCILPAHKPAINHAPLSSFTSHTHQSSTFLSTVHKMHWVSHLTRELMDVLKRRTSWSTSRELGGVARVAASRTNHRAGVLLRKGCETYKSTTEVCFSLNKGEFSRSISPWACERKTSHTHAYLWAWFP